MVHVDSIIRRMLKTDGKGNSLPFSARYVKANGELAWLEEGRIIRTLSRDEVLVRVPGGARRLRVWMFTELNGEEVGF